AFSHKKRGGGILLGLPLRAARRFRRFPTLDAHGDGEYRIVIGALAAADLVDRRTAGYLMRPLLQFGLGIAAHGAGALRARLPVARDERTRCLHAAIEIGRAH